jgi:hypothetical protein
MNLTNLFIITITTHIGQWTILIVVLNEPHDIKIPEISRIESFSPDTSNIRT